MGVAGRAGADCSTELCSRTGWGRRDTEKWGEAMRRGKKYRIADFRPPSSSCLPHTAFVLIFFTDETHLNLLIG